MSKVNLFKKISVPAVVASMCINMTLSASAYISADVKPDSAGIFVVKAEHTDTHSSYLSDLQPYFDELQAINEEFGYGIALCTSTEDDIAWLHSEFCSMTIPEYRDYIIDLYNSNYAYYDVSAINDCEAMSVAIISEQAPKATAATTFTAYQYLYADDSKTDNYFWVKSSQYNYISGGQTIKMYESVDSSGYHTVDFPTWKPASYTWKAGTSKTKVICTFNVHWYLAPKIYIPASASTFNVTLTAGTDSYSLNLPDYE